MSGAVENVNLVKANAAELPAAVVRRGINEAQWRTLFNLFPGAHPDSILMVVDYCSARKLDPLKKPCHIVPMRTKQGDQWVWKDVVMPGIYEYRITAQRTGLYLGHTEPVYGPEAEFLGVKAPAWCAMTFHRWNDKAQQSVPFPVKVWFAEVAGTSFDKTSKTDYVNDRWSRAPIQMLTKCFDDRTEVLTEEGFQRFADVEAARILQVTADGRLEPVAAKPFVQPYDGAMVTLDSDDLNFCVTPNHDMVTTHGKIEAGAMFKQARSRAKHWIPRLLPGTNGEADITDRRLRLAAAYLADGSDHSSARLFAVEVSRPRKVAALRELGLHNTEGVGSLAGAVARTAVRDIVTKTEQTRFTYSLSLVAPLVMPGKRVDVGMLLTLSKRQARIFVDTLVEFDGSTNAETGVRRFYTSRASHLHAFEIACLLAGYAVNKPTERMSDISSTPNFMVTISDRDAIPVRRVGRRFHETVASSSARTALTLTPNRSGMVWCVTVPSGVIVVRRDGFSMLCGNCTEAAGLREAFPEEFGGEATAEEMDGQRPIVDATPAAADLPKPAQRIPQASTVVDPPVVEDVEDVEAPEVATSNVQPATLAAETPKADERPAHIGRIADIREKPDGSAAFVVLDTGFVAGTQDKRIISDAKESREMGAIVELANRAPSDPAKFKPTILEVKARIDLMEGQQ